MTNIIYSLNPHVFKETKDVVARYRLMWHKQKN